MTTTLASRTRMADLFSTADELIQAIADGPAWNLHSVDISNVDPSHSIWEQITLHLKSDQSPVPAAEIVAFVRDQGGQAAGHWRHENEVRGTLADGTSVKFFGSVIKDSVA